MRIKSVWGAGVLAALATLTVLAPGKTLAQESWPQGGFATGYAPPAVQLPYPLYSTHPEMGGLFVAGSYIMYHQSNPLRGSSGPIAYRGFVATDDTVLDSPGTAGTFIGNRNLALDANQVGGPYTFVPGFQLDIGWKFGDGSALTASFWWISDAHYSAAATLVAPGLQFRSDQAQTYLTSFVYNFPADFAGAPDKVVNSNNTQGPFSVYGIWNGASIMTIELIQRAEQFFMTYRKPFYETECYRASALVGPKFFWIEDKFRWITTDLNSTGISSPIYVGVYNNQIDNRNYGLWTGLQQEWYLGWGVALMLDLNAGAFLDVAKTMVDYQRGDRGGPENKRTRQFDKVAAMVQATPSVMWYPLEGIQLQFGYDFFAFFNQVSYDQQPVDFNYSSLTPPYHDAIRYFNGFKASVAFIF